MYGKFLVEGDKPVRELLQSDFKVDAVFKVRSWNADFGSKKVEITDVTEVELRKISTHKTPNQVVAVAEIPEKSPISHYSSLPSLLYLACEDLSDPGNAGTIIRIADWFGIEKIFFSENSVDLYNPKVVSSAKGSLFRVKCISVDLKDLFEKNPHLKVYGAFIKGDNIYETKLPESAFIIIGNEANGISDELSHFVHHKISIPSFGKAESLNAAVATGIVVSEFKRKN